MASNSTTAGTKNVVAIAQLKAPTAVTVHSIDRMARAIRYDHFVFLAGAPSRTRGD